MLELKKICFRAEDEGVEKTILDDISFTIPNGKLVAITGPNGGGKSTTARIIAGIEKPSSGQVLLDGVDITGLSITERAQAGIGYAFQHPVRFKGIKVRDLITLAAGKEIGHSDACEYLSAVGLCARDYVTREVNSSLSGGELKRIEIATVLAKASKLSLFDEPEAGIDLWSFQNLIEVFQRMRDNIEDSSIIIISHQERILNIADEIIVMANGKLQRMGSKEEILPSLLAEDAVRTTCRGIA
ncbi:MAG: ATP-binding cassette domain-containing protein [Oscillospiraceae bacterium]|nr:ATP-binding cassette domain-containing protein [Oscillospiraceae bacterium]